MKKIVALSLLLALAVAAFASKAGSARVEEKTAATVSLGALVPDFTLPDADGKQHTLASLKGSKGTVILFIATKCPISNAYNARMAKLVDDYKSKGISVVGINSNVAELSDEVKKHAADNGLTFTILKDAGNQIADRFDAQVTPEAFVLDGAGKLVYHGRIDNSRNGDAITASELRDALDAIVAGKPVEKQEAKAFGCTIKRV